MIGAPNKMRINYSLLRHFPKALQVELVSADMGYRGARVWWCPSKRMIDRFIDFRPDLVFTDYPAYPSWYARLYSLLRRRHIPLLVWLLGDFWTEHFAFFSKAQLSTRAMGPLNLFTWSTGLRFGDRILAVCKWLEEIVKARLPGKSTGVLYQGVDPDHWFAGKESTYAFEHPAVGILQDNNILPKVNGLLRFSDVVKEMKEVHFYIAGGGRYTSLVQEKYSDLGNAHFVGRLPYPDGVRKFHLSTDVYVLPSGLDCCPTTLLEASLCERPTVASMVGGVPELIREEETGWTARNGQSDEWISRIRSLLEDRRLASRVGKNARVFVMKHFSWKVRLAELEPVVRDLVS